MILIFVSLVFLVAANFSLAAPSSYESLQTDYYQAIQKLVVLLKEQVSILSQKVQSAPSASSEQVLPGSDAAASATSSPVAVSSSSVPANNYSGSLFNYYPTWHLNPGSCFPSLY